jgi:hypothetical protein
LEILRVFNGWSGDPNYLAPDGCQFHGLPNTGFGVHRIAGDHRLHPDRMMSSNPHFPDHDLAG